VSAAVVERLIFRTSTKRNPRGQRPRQQPRPASEIRFHDLLEADLVAFVPARSLTLDIAPLYRRYAFLAVLQTGPRAIASLD
jgi:hypothetical protein